MAEMAIRVRNFTPAKRNSGIGAIVPAAKKKLQAKAKQYQKQCHCHSCVLWFQRIAKEEYDYESRPPVQRMDRDYYIVFFERNKKYSFMIFQAIVCLVFEFLSFFV